MGPGGTLGGGRGRQYQWSSLYRYMITTHRLILINSKILLFFILLAFILFY
jgi:hypothetical protein